MRRGRSLGWTVTSLVLAMAWLGHAESEKALAFVTEVEGSARIVRVGGVTEAAAMGGQLFSGDAIEATEGMAVLIYLSGRSVSVSPGSKHQVMGEQTKPTALMGRVMDTLGEIAGPQSEAERPVVHGMARDLTGLNGALPANSRISTPVFDFGWDALEGAAGYEFTLETPEGTVLATRALTETGLAAGDLSLERGVRYVWSVKETGSFMPRSSGKSWVEIADEEQAKELACSLAEIDSTAAEDTRELLKATSLYGEAYYYEAERLLKAREQKGPLTDIEAKVLAMAYAKMERWDRLPAKPEDAETGTGE